MLGEVASDVDRTEVEIKAEMEFDEEKFKETTV